MKTKDIPVIYDMIRLPWSVLKPRLKRRLVKGGCGKTSIDFEKVDKSGLSLLPLNFHEFLKIDEDKWSNLLEYYLNDELNFLGSGWVNILNNSLKTHSRMHLGMNEPDWNRIHRTGYLIPLGNSFNVLSQVLSEPNQDVKHCWEFARMHHLVQLGLAAKLFPERREEILNKVEQHLASFIDQCPSGQGVHWSSPMEASIRLTNILLCLDLLPEIWNEYFKHSCIEHYEYILNNLEHKEGLGTNHYLSNLMGLIVGGLYLKSSEIKSYTFWAIGEFDKELRKQFFSDGVNFEYSTYYHRLSTEISLISFCSANILNLDLSEVALQKLSRAVNLVRSLNKPDGHLPIFGDNDSGRIIELDPVLDMKMQPNRENSNFLMPTTSPAYADQLFYSGIISRLPLVEEMRLSETRFLDKPKLKYYQTWSIQYPEIEVSDLNRLDYSEGGIYLFKSKDLYLAINLMANPNGHRYHGHMHNDKGAFELYVHGVNLISDPGIYSYTSDISQRNRYRSTQVHPVPFTGIEQNRYLENRLGLFHLKLDVECKVLEIWEKGITTKIEYNGVIQIRKFEIYKDHLLIEDWCNKDFTVNKLPDVPSAPGYGKIL